MKHNFIGIAVMTVAYMVIGGIWYGAIFGDTWAMAAFGKSMAEVQKDGVSAFPYIVNLIGAFLECLFISWLVLKLNANTFTEGLKIGVFASIGLVFPSIVIHYLFLKMSTTIILLDFSMSVIMVLLVSGALAVWRRKKLN